MFWGMNLKPNRKYTQTSSKNFHISQAALEGDGLSEDASNKIYISGEDNQKFLICTLRKNGCEQVPLDLNFGEGDTICFQSIGTGNVSLSGYLIADADMYDDEEDEMSDIEDEVADNVPNGTESKKKKNQKKPKASAGSDEEEDDENAEEDDDALLKAALESDDEMGSENDDEEDDDDEDDDEEDEDDDEDEDDEDDDDSEEVEEPKSKVAKLEKKDSKQQQKQNGVAQNAQKSNKKAEKQQQKQPQQQKSGAGGEKTVAGGVKIEDIRVGNGPEAKTGKRAQVYYEGRLKSNNKMFDSLKNGAPFKFGIGRGEVIKGWDVGVVGMKVGGKRRITCPPHMAYGARGSPPTIPPNSTLVFEVELKAVN